MSLTKPFTARQFITAAIREELKNLQNQKDARERAIAVLWKLCIGVTLVAAGASFYGFHWAWAFPGIGIVLIVAAALDSRGISQDMASLEHSEPKEKLLQLACYNLANDMLFQEEMSDEEFAEYNKTLENFDTLPSDRIARAMAEKP